MCIHTHTDSKLMRALTAVMLEVYSAHPITLVNYRKDPHEHFTLYASGRAGAIRAAALLNAWHPRYRGNWAAFTVEIFPHLPSVPGRAAEFPSIEWPVEPSPNLVAVICFAYGTMTRVLPETQRCFDYAREQLLPGPEQDMALRLISVIRGVDYAAGDVAESVEATAAAQAAPVTERTSYSVVWRDEHGNFTTDRYDATHNVEIAASGVLAVTNEDGTLAALYAVCTWETVR